MQLAEDQFILLFSHDAVKLGCTTLGRTEKSPLLLAPTSLLYGQEVIDQNQTIRQLLFITLPYAGVGNDRCDRRKFCHLFSYLFLITHHILSVERIRHPFPIAPVTWWIKSRRSGFCFASAVTHILWSQYFFWLLLLYPYFTDVNEIMDSFQTNAMILSRARVATCYFVKCTAAKFGPSMNVVVVVIVLVSSYSITFFLCVPLLVTYLSHNWVI